MIVWDGGNNDTPFIRPDVHIVVCDPHRPGHELRYHPGETEPPHGRRLRDQQDGHGAARGRRGRARLDPLRQPRRRDRARRLPLPRRGGAGARDSRQARARGRGRPDADARGNDLRRGRARGEAARRCRAGRPPPFRGRLDSEDVRGVPAHLGAPPGHGVRPQADARSCARRSPARTPTSSSSARRSTSVE